MFLPAGVQATGRLEFEDGLRAGVLLQATRPVNRGTTVFASNYLYNLSPFNYFPMKYLASTEFAEFDLEEHKMCVVP